MRDVYWIRNYGLSVRGNPDILGFVRKNLTRERMIRVSFDFSELPPPRHSRLQKTSLTLIAPSYH